jgi:hypothetical protein
MAYGFQNLNSVFGTPAFESNLPYGAIGAYNSMTPSSDSLTGGGLFGSLGGIGGVLSGLGQFANLGLGIFSALQSSKAAKEQLGLAREAFGFEKALANRNIANQAQTINNLYDTATNAGIGLMGGIDAVSGQALGPNAETIAKIQQANKDRHVSGAPVG